MFKPSKLIATIVGFLSITLILSGCSQYTALPDKERYHRIVEVAQLLDYSTAGTITSAEKDDGDGVFSPSYYYISMEGENVYQILRDRIYSLPQVICSTHGDYGIRCRMGIVSIGLSMVSEDKDSIKLRIEDPLSGRRNASE